MNKQQALLLFSLSFFTGCVERGYNVTSNVSIHTVTAERITSIKPGKISKEQPNIEEKMLLDVKKTLKTQKEATTEASTVKKETKLRIKPKKSNTLATSIKTKEKQEVKEVKEVKRISPKKTKKVIPEKNNDFNEKNLLLEAARKSRELRKLKLKEAFELKRAARIKANKSASERFKNAKIGTTKIVESSRNKALRIERERALQRKIDQDNQRLAQIRKVEEEKLKQALRKQALEEAQQKEADLKKQQELVRKRLEDEAKKREIAQKERAEKERAEKQRHQAEQAKKAKHPTVPKVSKKVISTTELLKFHPIDKVYQKFGTSEVHGRVIYLDHGGREVRLSQTKIYLLPMSAKLNHWYSNYYLKNKSNKNNTTVNYLNKTSLTAAKKFEFFGVPKGTYYVIIESITSSNQKVYIAKKINVGKYKKVMGIFSKKL